MAKRMDLIVCAVAATAVMSSAHAEPKAVESVGPVAIVHPGEGAVIPGRTIQIEGRAIRNVVDADDGEAERGLFAVPALIDSHVHYMASPDTYGPMFIACGVALVRDMGADTDMILDLKTQLESGERLGPSMLCTGRIVDGSPPVWPFSYECTTPDEGRAAVRELKERGVDFIKVYSILEPEVYQAVCDEAKVQGLRAVGHIPSRVDLDLAIEAGQYTNEHMMMLPQDFVPRARESEHSPIPDWWWYYDEAQPESIETFLIKLAQSGMIQCPTLVVMEGIRSAGDGSGSADARMQYVDPPSRRFWSMPRYAAWGRTLTKTNPYRIDLVGKMHDAGVTIIAGTDLANPYVFAGFSLHDELGHFVDAGMSNAEALACATSVPAGVLGVEDRLGSIEAGKEASFFLTPVNPLEDLRGALASIDSVVFRGRLYERADLDALLEGVASDVSVESVGELDEDEESMEVEGEILHRGRVKMKFGDFDSGHEDFVITRSEDGYRLYSSNRPQGSPQPPSDAVYHLDGDRTLVRIEYEDRGRRPFRAVYVLEGDEVVATITKEGVEEETQRSTLGDDRTLTGPSWMLDFYKADALEVEAMNVGDKLEYVSCSFGWNGAAISKSPVTLERLEDEALAGAEGGQSACKVYEAAVTTPMGVFQVRSWVDEQRITRRTTMKMPMGTITAELEPSPE